MNRFEKSKVLAKLLADYYNEKEGTTKYTTRGFLRMGGLVRVIAKKEELLDIVKWLWKHHRKEYYYLSFLKSGKKSYSFNNAIHEDWGDNGYLPHFSDTPDYYYIYG